MAERAIFINWLPSNNHNSRPSITWPRFYHNQVYGNYYDRIFCNGDYYDSLCVCLWL